MDGTKDIKHKRCKQITLLHGRFGSIVAANHKKYLSFCDARLPIKAIEES